MTDSDAWPSSMGLRQFRASTLSSTLAGKALPCFDSSQLQAESYCDLSTFSQEHQGISACLPSPDHAVALQAGMRQQVREVE